jgi:hypothetical protein
LELLIDILHACHGHEECGQGGITGRFSSLLIGHCILDALQHHSIHEIGAQNVLSEALLLEERKRAQRRRRMAAQTRSVIHAMGTIVGRNYSLQVFGVFGLVEVLKVAKVGDKLRLVEHFLHGEVIEIDGIGKALYELGAVRAGIWGRSANGPRAPARTARSLRSAGGQEARALPCWGRRECRGRGRMCVRRDGPADGEALPTGTRRSEATE